jgi:RNA polymerase sigma factor for flagellar operon FliA
VGRRKTRPDLALTPDQWELVADNLGLARTCAWRFAKRLRSSTTNLVDVDDLVAFATRGLIDAASRYEPGHVAFSTYAWYRMHGEVIDGLRREHLKRGQVHSDFAQPLSLDRLVEDRQEPFALDTVEALLEGEDVRRAVGQLDGRDREMIVRFYWRRETLMQIGSSWGVTESRASQIKTRAEGRLARLITISEPDAIGATCATA